MGFLLNLCAHLSAMGPRGELEHLGFGEASAGWAQALRERSKSTQKPRHFFGPSQNGGGLHPGRLTWNLKMMVWKMTFLFNWVIFRFHPIIFRECTWRTIPFSKWLGSPPFINHLDYLEGEQPHFRGLINHGY